MANKQTQFSPEEVQAILERALQRSSGNDPTNITYDELLDTADELDIDKNALEAAITEYEETYALQDARERWKKRRKGKFFEHLRAYMIVNTALAIIDFIVSGGALTWVHWPVLGWGIGIAFDAAEAFYPKDKDVERGARRLLQKEQKERRKIERKETWHNLADGIRKQLSVESKGGKIVIEKGDRRIEIG